MSQQIIGKKVRFSRCSKKLTQEKRKFLGFVGTVLTKKDNEVLVLFNNNKIWIEPYYLDILDTKNKK